MMRVQVTDERRAGLIEAIQAFYADRFGDQLGDLKAGLILDFFVERLGPPIYNQAIHDAHDFISEKLIDLDGEFYEPDEER
ncbi:MAG: DUF2164 domain-containing protein [Deltaproteobacteria bacterium]|nr:DUF2164 domain-containing protein [Deltaproteobacteria bacterium]MBW2394707.1 DUF2164 domain-containing protein [Deltaproteobacteria bacterium]